MKYLLTYTLLNSWKYWLDYDEEDDSKAKKDFENTLNKVSFDNRYIQAGKEFETWIRLCCDLGYSVFHDTQCNGDIQIVNHKVVLPAHDSYAMCIKEIAYEVKNGVWQVPNSIDINISGQLFVLYSKSDVLRGPDLYDIKYTTNYQGMKYYDSCQHRIYFKCFQGVQDCHYLVSNGKEVYRETYHRDETESIMPMIRDFWSWLNQFPDYLRSFKEHWKSKY